MKIFDIDWYKWVTGVLLAAMGSGFGYIIAEVKDVDQSATEYTDKTFERYRENQDAILNSALNTIQGKLKENNRKIKATVEDQIKSNDEFLNEIKSTVDSYVELSTAERSEIRKELRSLVSFAQRTRDEVIEVTTRLDERR